MDRIEQYRVFIRVAEMGSFIGAAHALEIPRASVSSAVQQLESMLGTQLLNRTTRQVSLTDDGSRLLDPARRLVADADALQSRFQDATGEIVGRLRIEAPTRLARRLIIPALPDFLELHPRIDVRLGSSDREVDLVREGIDAAIRVGRLRDSGLVARQLGNVALVNCASPAYLQRHGTPASPDQLAADHWLVGYARNAGPAEPWEWQVGETTQVLALRNRVIVDSAEAYIAGAVAGLGLIQVPQYDIQHLLDDGRLVDVLPAFRAAPMPVAVVFPGSRRRSPALSALVNWIHRLLTPSLDD